MQFWITRTSRESFMLTSLPPTIATVNGSDRRKAFITIGDPIGVKNLCLLGVRAIAPNLKLEVLESKQIEISVELAYPPDTHYGMAVSRWTDLTFGDATTLTPKELEEGWHWCADWDDMLIHKDSKEMALCTCKLELPVVATL